MNLGQQIHTLLKRQPEVFVQNLGTFKRIHTSASFDEKRKVYLPPLAYIEFDKTSTSGADFVQYVQQLHQITRVEAENLVADEVNKLANEILKSGQVSLDSLGHLVSFGNSYVFKPLDLSGFNYSPVEDTFYKPDVSLPKEEEQLITENVVEQPEDESTVLAEEEVQEEEIVEEQAPVIEEKQIVNNAATTPTHLEYEEPVRRRSNTGTYIFLAILALAVLGGIYYYNTYWNKPVQLTSVENAEIIADSSLIEQDSTALLDTVLTNTIDSVAPNTVDSTALVDHKPQALAERDEVKKYTIIIGTHRTLALAYDQAEAYNKDGHKSVRVVTPNLAKNLKRVIWDTYATKEERDAALVHVRKHVIADAWPDILK